MFRFKHSLKNLVRMKGRNLAVLLTAILTLTAVMLSYSMQTLSALAISRYQKRFGVQASIVCDWEKLEQEHPPEQLVNEDGSIAMEQNFEVPLPQAGEYAYYAQSSYVKRTLYHASCPVASDSLKPVKDNLKQGEEIIDISGMGKEALMQFFHVETEQELEETVGGREELEKIIDTKSGCVGSLIGFTDLSLLEEFTSKKRRLEQGKLPQNKNECMISSAFAAENNLRPGDTMNVSGPSRTMDQETLTLHITGIYGDYFHSATAETFGMTYGDIFTTYETLMNSGFHYIELLSGIFILKNPQSAPLFEQELHDKGLSEYQTLEYSTEEYESYTKPLKHIARIAQLFTGLASLTGAAVLLLIVVINMRERRYELGVLRSMGMTKSAIARGMLYELWLLMLAAFAVSFPAAWLLTKPAAVRLLGSLSNVRITLPAASVYIGAGLAFLVSMLTGLCMLVCIMRHEPMKLLAKRS